MQEKKNWIVKLDNNRYYSENNAWQYVEKECATKMKRKDATRVANYLRQPKIGYKTDIEETTL